MIAALFSVALAAAAPALTPARLPPVEQCRDDHGFVRFRSALEDAVTRKDVPALRRLTAPNVIAHFGGGSSWDGFAAEWGLSQNPAMSALWKEMAAAIALGCAHTPDGGRVFPGMFEAMGDDVDPFELLVARPGTRLRSNPDRESAVIANLEWSSAILVEAKAPEGWARVQLLGNGPLGWVETDAMISPLGYRLVAEKRGGTWLVTAFVAGD
jgi:hypothetical protein